MRRGIGAIGFLLAVATIVYVFVMAAHNQPAEGWPYWGSYGTGLTSFAMLVYGEWI